MEFTAVILAAGSGTRLRPLTLETPKCLLDVGGRTILARQLERARAAGIRRAVVVTGHLAGQVEQHLRAVPPPIPVTLAPNPVFASTGNCMSVLAARPCVETPGIVLCDGDVVLTGDAMAALLAAPAQTALLLDRETPLAHEEMKVRLDAGGLVRQLSKQLEPAESAGESIGVQKVSGPALPIFWATLEAMRDAGDDQGYYEDAFQRMLDAGVPIRTVEIAHAEWTEIDDLQDLEAARRRFAGA